MPLALSDGSDSEASVTGPTSITRGRSRSSSDTSQGPQHDQADSEFNLSLSPGSTAESDSEEGLGRWTAKDGEKWQRENGLEEESGSYGLETIIRWRRHPRRGHVQYRAAWSGYNLYGNTWEPEKNFSKGQLEEFWAREGGRPESVPQLLTYNSKGSPIDPPSLSDHSSDTVSEQLHRDQKRRKRARRKLRLYLRADKPVLRAVRAQRHAAEQRRKAEHEEHRRLKRAARAGRSPSDSSSSAEGDSSRATKKPRLETTTRPTTKAAGPSRATKAGPSTSAGRASRLNAAPSSAATMTARERIQAKRRQEAAKAGGSGSSSFPIGKDASAAAKAQQLKKEEEEAQRLERQKKARSFITAAPKKGAMPVTDFKQLGKAVKAKAKAAFDPLGLSAPAGPSRKVGGAASPSKVANSSNGSGGGANKPVPPSVSTRDASSLSRVPTAPSPISATSAAPTSTAPIDTQLKAPPGAVMARGHPPPQAARSSGDPRRRPPAPAAAAAPAPTMPDKVEPAKASGVQDRAQVPPTGAATATPAPSAPAQRTATIPALPVKAAEVATLPATSTTSPPDPAVFAPTPELDDSSRAEGIEWATKWGFAHDAVRRSQISRAYNVVLYEDEKPEIYTKLHAVIRVMGGGFKLKLESRYWEAPHSRLLLWMPSASSPLPAAVARAKLAPNVSFLAYEGGCAPQPIFGDAQVGFVGLTVSALVQCLLGSDVAAPGGAEVVLHPWHRKLLNAAFDEGQGQQLVHHVLGCDSSVAAEQAASLVDDPDGKMEALARELDLAEAHLGWEDAPDLGAVGVEAAVKQVDEAMAETMRQLQARHSAAKHHILQVGPVTALDLDKIGVSWQKLA